MNWFSSLFLNLQNMNSTLLSPSERNFVHWAIQNLVSGNTVKSKKDGSFFIQKDFFEEMRKHTQHLGLAELKYMHNIRLKRCNALLKKLEIQDINVTGKAKKSKRSHYKI